MSSIEVWVSIHQYKVQILQFLFNISWIMVSFWFQIKHGILLNICFLFVVISICNTVHKSLGMAYHNHMLFPTIQQACDRLWKAEDAQNWHQSINCYG